MINEIQSAIQWRYGLNRDITEKEISAEITMLLCKDEKGTLDCKTLPYFCRMKRAGAFK